ncbi:putative long-chain-fatty-acid-CoA ligase [Trypanosoma conorhini]|uniref:Putative long-chain-fatty-acid-CoA ligase n=1 Tax=Trypanosoma conorhini TaxID=83891 RepID=A0A3R7L632_9TRYP|nr:putative long-chain-fatty-acid-CoA ligase [Trypanosoma conorhini]RNF16934.1 putative long-chain-fatty-acid-CoA ligase [Trypanosoma conorhini]
MGGCLASVLDKRNQMSLVDFREYQEYMQRGKQAEPVPGTEKANASAIYRISGTSDEQHNELVESFYRSETLSQRVYNVCMERGERTAMTYRVLKNTEYVTSTDANGKEKKLEVYVFEPQRRNISYAQLWACIENLGKGLTEIDVKKGSKVALYEETRWEWFCSIHAIWSRQMVATTVYANLGEDALAYALQETQCEAIICGGNKVAKLVELLRKEDMHDSVIIYLDKLPEGTDTAGYVLYSWTDVLKKGEASQLPCAKLPTSENCDDLSLIMYTSGTTGAPKGVMHSHGSIAAGFSALACRVLDILGEYKEPETYCSYLPLAHVMELAVLSILFLRGCLIGFGSPRTLTNVFAKPRGDFEEYHPVLVAGVPRIFDTIKRGVEAKLPPAGSFKRNVFDRACQSRLKALKEGKDTPYYNAKVFAQARNAVGGRARMFFSGGGPMNPATQEFMNIVFGVMIQGWGLTETVCCGGVQLPGNLDYGSVGQPLKSLELRLLDADEYKHTDKPEPRGEILLRGPFLFKGYYKQDEQTREVLDEDGWFHTGDVGAIAANGTISIVGRIKALAKNSNGEYIALETMEAVYGANSLITPNGVCVLVHPGRSYTVALGLTTEKLAMDFAKANKIPGSFPAILESKEFRAKATQSFQATARKANRKSFEVVRHVRLLAEEWTAENDMLTAALKLKRRVIDERYKDLIEELFAEDL